MLVLAEYSRSFCLYPQSVCFRALFYPLRIADAVMVFYDWRGRMRRLKAYWKHKDAFLPLIIPFSVSCLTLSVWHCTMEPQTMPGKGLIVLRTMAYIHLNTHWGQVLKDFYVLPWQYWRNCLLVIPVFHHLLKEQNTTHPSPQKSCPKLPDSKSRLPGPCLGVLFQEVLKWSSLWSHISLRCPLTITLFPALHHRFGDHLPRPAPGVGGRGLGKLFSSYSPGFLFTGLCFKMLISSLKVHSNFVSRSDTGCLQGATSAN